MRDWKFLNNKYRCLQVQIAKCDSFRATLWSFACPQWRNGKVNGPPLLATGHLPFHVKVITASDKHFFASCKFTFLHLLTFSYCAHVQWLLKAWAHDIAVPE